MTQEDLFVELFVDLFECFSRFPQDTEATRFIQELANATPDDLTAGLKERIQRVGMLREKKSKFSSLCSWEACRS